MIVCSLQYDCDSMDVENIGKEKWTEQRFKLKDLKQIMSKWQKGLEHEGGIAYTGIIMISRGLFLDLEMMVYFGKNLLKCLQSASI